MQNYLLQLLQDIAATIYPTSSARRANPTFSPS